MSALKSDMRERDMRAFAEEHAANSELAYLQA